MVTAPEWLTSDLQWPPPTGSRWAGCGRQNRKKTSGADLERRRGLQIRNRIADDEPNRSAPVIEEFDTDCNEPTRILSKDGGFRKNNLEKGEEGNGKNRA